MRQMPGHQSCVPWPSGERSNGLLAGGGHYLRMLRLSPSGKDFSQPAYAT